MSSNLNYYSCTTLHSITIISCTKLISGNDIA